MRLTTRSILTSLATWLATSPAAADERTLHNAVDDAARPSTPSPAAAHAPAATIGSPESPYDTAPSVASGADDYAQPGRVEIGAAFSATIASQVRDVSATLSFGRFVAERFELLALASVTNLDVGDQSATLWSSVVEPAYHLPLAPAMFGVLGMGVGVAYTSELGLGLAIAPRLGLRFRVGRWGVVTPALSYVYVTHGVLDRTDDLAVIAVTGALRLQLGYAVSW